MFTDNPNRAKARRASGFNHKARLSARSVQGERTTTGEPITTGVTIVRADPAKVRAALRRGDTGGIVASAHREIAGKRHASGTALLARGVKNRGSIPARRAEGERRAAERASLRAANGAPIRATTADRIMDRAERAEQRGNFALAAALLEQAARLDMAEAA